MKNKRIKVCFISMASYPVFFKTNDPFGGGEVYQYFISKSMANNNNFEISTVVGDYGQPKIVEKDKIKLIKSIKYGFNLINILRNPFKLWRALSEANADVYLTMIGGMEVGFVALFSKLNNRKFIFRSANSVNVDGGTQKKLGKIIGSTYAWGLKRADVVLTANKKEQLNAKEKYGKDSIITLKSWPIPKLDSSLKKEYIFWVGRATNIKQPELFIRLAEENPDMKFVMILMQSSDPDCYKNIISKGEKIKNLTFQPRVPIDEVGSFFEKAKCLVSTSIHEGNPNIFIQSYLVRTPVVSLNVDPGGVIKEKELGFVSDGDFEELNKYVRKVWFNPSLAHKMGENAREYAKKNCDINDTVKKWSSIIEELIKRNGE